jgi:hypothetical protein
VIEAFVACKRVWLSGKLYEPGAVVSYVGSGLARRLVAEGVLSPRPGHLR